MDLFVAAALPLSPEFAAADPGAPASAVADPAGAKPGNGTHKAMHNAEQSGLILDRRTSIRSSSGAGEWPRPMSGQLFANSTTNDNDSHSRRQVY